MFLLHSGGESSDSSLYIKHVFLRRKLNAELSHLIESKLVG